LTATNPQVTMSRLLEFLDAGQTVYVCPWEVGVYDNGQAYCYVDAAYFTKPTGQAVVALTKLGNLVHADASQAVYSWKVTPFVHDPATFFITVPHF
jgi:hypothetical protein